MSIKTHLMTSTRFYRVWGSMKRRCNYPSQLNYKDYGGRGISYCSEWESFENFKRDVYDSYMAHVEIHGEQNTTMERIDSNGNYEFSNCRWATQTEQARNRRTSRLLTHEGITQSLAQWADDCNLTYAQLKLRLKRGWELEKALKTGRLVNQYST